MSKIRQINNKEAIFFIKIWLMILFIIYMDIYVPLN